MLIQLDVCTEKHIIDFGKPAVKLCKLRTIWIFGLQDCQEQCALH